MSDFKHEPHAAAAAATAAATSTATTATSNAPAAAAAGLTLPEFRARLYGRFQHSGMLRGLKTQLRSQLVQRFNLTKSGATSGAGEQPTPLLQRVLNTLIADYLESCDYAYTQSMFLPESATPAPGGSGALSYKDVFHILQYVSCCCWCCFSALVCSLFCFVYCNTTAVQDWRRRAPEPLATGVFARSEIPR
jgi:hypothetical protein